MWCPVTDYGFPLLQRVVCFRSPLSEVESNIHKSSIWEGMGAQNFQAFVADPQKTEQQTLVGLGGLEQVAMSHRRQN